MDFLLPRRSRPAKRLLEVLVHAARQAPPEAKRAWRDHQSFLRGDLGGQRGSSLEALAQDVGICFEPATSLCELLAAIDAFAVFVANTIALLGAARSPGSAPEGLADLADEPLAAYLAAICNGEAFLQRGVVYPPHPIALDWWPELLDDEGLAVAREFVEQLCDRPAALEAMHQERDPFGNFYLALAPKALLHPTGEHYTPYWLAEHLVVSTRWRPGQRLLDPFGGSGVVALAAMDIAKRCGASAVDALDEITLIELNPVTAALAKANLVSRLAGELPVSGSPIRLPVICADTLTCAMDSCGALQEDLWRSARPTLRIQGQPHTDRLLDIDLADASANPGLVQQARASRLEAADVLVTNPPWVGWEYMPKDYREYIVPLWQHYSLFESSGREAAFLKEDLSTLALMVAFDRFLAAGGRAATVLRYASMTSNAAAGGLRRLHIVPSDTPLSLRRVDVFDDVRVFDRAITHAAAWHLEKDAPTTFPVPANQWRTTDERRSIDDSATLEEVERRTECVALSIRRDEPNVPKSRWVIGDTRCLEAAKSLIGANSYRARTGVFTGGANAVYYLEPLEAAPDEDGVSWYRNRTERARRKAPKTCSKLEDELVYQTVRGRDIGRWEIRGHSHLLCPHTRATKIRAIAPSDLAAHYPFAADYLSQMRPVLEQRRGFSGWEKDIRKEAFYAILRIGEYTFEPYKVAWRYLSDDFIVSVIPPAGGGRPQLPNDKVMYVGLEDPAEAYYLCGVLSSAPVRWKVVSSSTSTQISASIIETLGIPAFDATNSVHIAIAEACEEGHHFVSKKDVEGAKSALDSINTRVGKLFGLDSEALAAFASVQASTFGPPFS